MALVLVVAAAVGWIGLSWSGGANRSAPQTQPSVDGGAPTDGPGPTTGPPASHDLPPSAGPSAGASSPTSAPSSTPSPTPVPVPESATPELRNALDARLERLRARRGIPGISAAIVFPDGSVWVGTAGVADVDGEKPVTMDTAFPAASVTKTFTSALILGLVEDGRLSLDSRVRTYLPDLAIDRAITVRQLLDHTSGLRDFYFHPSVDKALLTRPARVWDAQRSLKYVRKSLVKPGVAWGYSNTNYLVLGMLAEAVGEGSVAQQLRTRFFDPLGLEHTWYQGTEAPRGPLAHGYRFLGSGPTLPGIDLADGTEIAPFSSVVTASGAAGSIAANATDLARWGRALYDGPALTEASRAAMLDDVVRTAPYRPTVPYGLGVQATTIGGRLALGHSGRFLGARASLRWLPEQRVSIAILTNQSRSDPAPIVANLLRLVLGPATPVVP